MADTGKSVRVARTQFGGGLAQAGVPTEKSQLVGQEVHQYRDTESDALYQLNDAIGRFMGAGVNALTSVQEGYQRGKLAEIEQANKAQKAQALGDALAGKEMDPALSGDDDYYSAFRSVKAQRDGFDAAQEFTSWYMTQWLPDNPTGDLAAARQQWALENITGSDDPDYEGQLIASFFDRTDGLLPEHMKAALKYQTDKGTAALGSLVEADVASGAVTVEKLNDYFEKARVLDPMNAAEAPTRVVNALLAAASNHPDKMMGVSGLLAQPGTGVNGKSFAQSFPDAYAAFQQQAVSAFNEINSTKELESFTSLQDRLREAKTPDDLTAITVDALKHRQEFGNPGRINELLNGIDTALTQMGKNIDLTNATMAWVGGDRSVDPSDVKKGFPLLLDQMGVKTILEIEPAKAAQILNGMGSVVADEAKDVLTTSLLDTRSPADQAKAMETLTILARTTGKDTATAYLNTAAKNLFDHAWAIQAVQPNIPMDAILARVNEARDTITDWDLPWQKITGAEDGKKADEAVNKVITDQLNARLGEFGNKGVVLPATLSKSIMDAARLKALEFDASGLGWEAGVKSAVDDITSNADLIPSADGKTQMLVGATQKAQYVNDEGVTVDRPRMGRAVINPTTGKPVDTIDVFDKQADEIALTTPALLPGGRSDAIFLRESYDPTMKARGLFAVTGPDNQTVTFAAGQEVTLGAQQPLMPVMVDGVQVSTVANLDYDPAKQPKATIPDNAADMAKLFDLPEGFAWVRADTASGIVWQMGYRLNFGTQKGKTLDQQAETFKPTPIPQEPTAPTPVGLPMGTIDFPADTPDYTTGGGF